MPYIKREDRKDLDIASVVSPKTPGELNYVFTVLAKKYLLVKGESYQTYNDIVGALECCKLEMYRRRVSGYEDKKRWENGDVWDEEEQTPPVNAMGEVIKK